MNERIQRKDINESISNFCIVNKHIRLIIRVLILCLDWEKETARSHWGQKKKPTGWRQSVIIDKIRYSPYISRRRRCQENVLLKQPDKRCTKNNSPSLCWPRNRDTSSGAWFHHDRCMRSPSRDCDREHKTRPSQSSGRQSNPIDESHSSDNGNPTDWIPHHLCPVRFYDEQENKK